MIKANNIKLDERFSHYQSETTAETKAAQSLKPVSKINIFVGANNSGKSRFLRMLSCTKVFTVDSLSIEVANDVKDELFSLLGLLGESLTQNGGKVADVTREAIDGLVPSFPIDSVVTNTYLAIHGYFVSLETLLLTMVKVDGNSRFFGHKPYYDLPTSSTPDTNQKITEAAGSALEITHRVLKELEGKEINDASNVYIPVLRGIRLLDGNHLDYYKTQTIKDYFAENAADNSTPEIFTGLGFHHELTNLLLGNNKQRLLVQEYQKFISKNLFEGKSVEFVPNQITKTVIVKIGDEIEREIHFKGDGIQSAIILTFLPFITKEPTYFFIEEPEMYLHPGLQRKILEFFNSDECKQHKFFMTTHSNHFLDITIDIKDVSIFTFRKRLEDGEHNEKSANFIIEAVDGTDQSSLELLGVRNSSVFLVNATIWVEGITERWYLRKMLHSYMEQTGVKEVEEDVHYCFVEYAGSNIVHWSFLNKEEHPIVIERLCAKALVIVDGDGGTKQERKKELLKNLTLDSRSLPTQTNSL